METGRKLDAELRLGKSRGALHGIPVLVKDNIDTAGDEGTTAGSLALAMTRPTTDAVVVQRLRSAGAIVIAKSNLSEWANFRATHSSSGWSAIGGQCRNPHALDRSPGGSSSGSGAGVAAGLAPMAVGTETDGSILCPAALNGVVGIKPTVGLTSRTGVVPVSSSQDTVGPLARNVADASALLGVLAGGAGDVRTRSIRSRCLARSTCRTIIRFSAIPRDSRECGSVCLGNTISATARKPMPWSNRLCKSLARPEQS